MHKSKIKKSRNKHEKTVLLAKSKFNSIEVLISKALTDANITHDKFVLINNALNEFYIIKEKIKNSIENKMFRLCVKQCYLIVWSVEKMCTVKKWKNGRIMLLLEFVMCNSKKLKFIKDQEARGLLGSLGVRTSLKIKWIKK